MEIQLDLDITLLDKADIHHNIFRFYAIEICLIILSGKKIARPYVLVYLLTPKVLLKVSKLNDCSEYAS